MIFFRGPAKNPSPRHDFSAQPGRPAAWGPWMGAGREPEQEGPREEEGDGPEEEALEKAAPEGDTEQEETEQREALQPFQDISRASPNIPRTVAN